MNHLLRIPGLRGLALRTIHPAEFYRKLAEGQIPTSVVEDLTLRACREPDAPVVRLGNWNIDGRTLLVRILEADAPGISPAACAAAMQRALEIGGFSMADRAGSTLLLRAVTGSADLAEAMMVNGPASTLNRLGSIFPSLPESLRARLIQVMVQESFRKEAPGQAAMWSEESSFVAALAAEAGRSSQMDRALAQRPGLPLALARRVLSSTIDAGAVQMSAARLRPSRENAGEDPAPMDPADLVLYVNAADRACRDAEAALAAYRRSKNDPRSPEERQRFTHRVAQIEADLPSLRTEFERVAATLRLSDGPAGESVAQTLLEVARRNHAESGHYASLGRALVSGLAANRSLNPELLHPLIDIVAQEPDGNLPALAGSRALGQAQMWHIVRVAMDRLRLDVTAPSQTAHGSAAALERILARADAPADLIAALTKSELLAERVDVDAALWRNAAAPMERKRAYLERILAEGKKTHEWHALFRAALERGAPMSLVREILADPRSRELIPSDAAVILVERWTHARGVAPHQPHGRYAPTVEMDRNEDFANLLPGLVAGGGREPDEAKVRAILEAEASTARERDPAAVSSLIVRAREILASPPSEEHPLPAFEARLILERLRTYAEQSGDPELARLARHAMGTSPARGLRSALDRETAVQEQAVPRGPARSR
jgi:hypothetical protein